MKLFTYSLLSLLAIAFYSCGVEYSYYHSTADIPKYSRSVLTEAKLIEWPEDSRRNFGVVVATDFKSLDPTAIHYALIVPASEKVAVSHIDNLRMGYASPILKDDLSFLVKEIDKILSEWDKNTSELNGTFYEFNYTPEHEIIELSPNVVRWYPSVYFGFQDTENRSIGVLIIGPEQGYLFKYEFEEMKELSVFQSVLYNALKEIEVREKNSK